MPLSVPLSRVGVRGFQAMLMVFALPKCISPQASFCSLTTLPTVAACSAIAALDKSLHPERA